MYIKMSNKLLIYYLYNKKWNGKGYEINGNIIYELINDTGKLKEYNNSKRD